MPGLDPKKLPGVVIDDAEAELVGSWSEGTGLRGYVGWSYRYASPNQKASAKFETRLPKSGRYQLKVYNGTHENRATSVPIEVRVGPTVMPTIRINQREKTESDVIDVGEFEVPEDEIVTVTFKTDGAGGFVHVDAIAWEPVSP